MFETLMLFPSLSALLPGLLQLPEGMGRVLLLFAVLAGFVLMELRCGKENPRTSLARRSLRINLSTLVMNDVLLSLLSTSFLLVLAERVARRGLLDGLGDPWRGLATFVLLDLTLYFWHRTCHALPWLWRFHRIHHSDPFLNVSTAFRLHLVEVLLTTVIKAGFILVTGVEVTLVLASETLVTLWVMFHHANLCVAGERWLAWLFTVPSLHRLHHSTQRDEHDRNYGFVFSFWDRLLGTLAVREPVDIGLNLTPPGNWLELFKLSFQPLHAPADAPLPSGLVERMIAEAAYYRAEKRGFASGFEMEDWVAAERQILAPRQR
ncbi:MAG: hypothetical protein Kow0060_13940 [Methylohalobius crimeensis]